jgi:hypothetical protein
MTLNERNQVVKLTKLLFPNEIERYDKCEVACAVCEEQIAEWNALIWRVYEALMKCNLI